MAKENDDTKPEGNGTEGDEEDEEANRLLSDAVNGGRGKESDDEEREEREAEAEAEAGANDTVPRAELLKAIRSRQTTKAKLRELQEQLTAERAKNESESERKVREAQEKAVKAATDRYKPALVKAGATAALLAASPKKGKEGVPRLLRLMDLNAIDLTEDNDLEGVEEEVLRLQEEYPELFIDPAEEKAKQEKESTDEDEERSTRRPARRTTSRTADGAGKKPAPKKLTTSELLMAKLRGEA
jgi:hypothetical protein